MKKFLLFLFISTALFSSELFVKNSVLKCSKLQNNSSRLTCFDNLASAVKPDNEEKLQAKILIQSCTKCHGSRWDIPTKSGSSAVRHMTHERIEGALLEYKNKNRDSAIMQSVMNEITSKEIELISKYIIKNAKETR